MQGRLRRPHDDVGKSLNQSHVRRGLMDLAHLGGLCGGAGQGNNLLEGTDVLHFADVAAGFVVKGLVLLFKKDVDAKPQYLNVCCKIGEP